MLSESISSPTFYNQVSYKPRPIFAPITNQSNYIPAGYTYIVSSPPPQEEVYQKIDPNNQEIIKLTQKIQAIEKEKSIESREKESLKALVGSLKAQNQALEQQVKGFLEGSLAEDPDVLNRLKEQEALFQRKEKILEEERNQLLQALTNKEALLLEKHEENQKECEFLIEDLRRQIDEKDEAFESLSQSNRQLIETIEELKQSFLREKEDNFQYFESQKMDLEEKTNKILEENQKVVLLNKGLINENETLRALNHGLEDRHKTFIEEIKSSFKTQIETNKANQKASFDLEKVSLENQIRDLNEFSENLKEKFETVIQENQALREEKEISEENCENRVNEVEEKMKILLEKNQNLLSLLEANREETETLHRDFKQISDENFNFIRKYKEENEKALRSEQILERKETGFQIEVEELKSNKIKLESHLQDLEHKILDLLADNEKLNGALLDRIKENELLKVANTNNKILNEKNEELLTLKEINSSKLRDMEEKFERLLSENHKLNTVFEKTLKELETSKARVGILENELESKLKVRNL